MRVPRLVSFGIFVLAAAFLALACGGGKEEETARPAATRPAASAPAASPTPAAPARQTLEISAIPTLKFDQTELRARAGAEITVKFNATDTGIPHNWALYADDSASKAIAGANENICTAPCTKEVTFGPLDAGEYFFRCDVHPIQMTGELIVG